MAVGSGSAPQPPPPNEHRQRTALSSEEVKRPASGSDYSALGSAQKNSFWTVQKVQDFMPMVQSGYKVFEDAFVNKCRDGLVIALEHPVEACGVTVAAGLLLMRGPRRFLLRNTLGRLQSVESRFTKAELSLKELGQSVEQLKKESKNVLLRANFSEEALQRGRSKVRDAGHEIRRLAKSIYKIESNAAGMMDGLRAIPGRNSLKLRAEVASMAADLKKHRSELDKKIIKISEYGIPL